MNIFATDPCPVKSVLYLDNKRLVKMCLESAQMLSTAIWYHGGTDYPYKPTHVNHPCSKWVRETRYNYLWLFLHFEGLCQAYKQKYNRTHKCYSYFEIFFNNAKLIPDGKLTDFVNCTRSESLGVDFTKEKDVHIAYRKYLKAKQKL